MVREGVVAELEAPSLPELHGAGVLRFALGPRVARVRGHLASARSDLVVAVSSMRSTTNQTVTQWGHVFVDEMSAQSVLDRVRHHSYVVMIQGDSFRRRHKKRATLLGSEKTNVSRQPRGHSCWRTGVENWWRLSRVREWLCARRLPNG
jgi:hypothetical protein